MQQCIQISTRINSTNVHTYVCVCFIRNVSNIQHNRGVAGFLPVSPEWPIQLTKPSLLHNLPTPSCCLRLPSLFTQKLDKMLPSEVERFWSQTKKRGFFDNGAESHKAIAARVMLCVKTELYPEEFKREVTFITALNEVGARLCFYTCLWFCSQWGWYISMSCSRSPGEGLQVHTRGGVSRPTPRGVSRPTPRGISRVCVCIPACTETDPPHVDGYCRGRYASYWNTFLFN